jgi:hypothetical protein
MSEISCLSSKQRTSIVSPLLYSAHHTGSTTFPVWYCQIAAVMVACSVAGCPGRGEVRHACRGVARDFTREEGHVVVRTYRGVHDRIDPDRANNAPDANRADRAENRIDPDRANNAPDTHRADRARDRAQAADADRARGSDDWIHSDWPNHPAWAGGTTVVSSGGRSRDQRTHRHRRYRQDG